MKAEISTLKGIGPQLVKKFEKLGIRTVEDLLFHFPLRYQDRRRVRPIAGLEPGSEALVEGTIDHTEIIFRRRRILLVHISDAGGRMQLRFFHFSAAQRATLKTGRKLYCFGEVRIIGNAMTMIHPEYSFVNRKDNAHNTAYMPVYPTTEGLSQYSLRRFTDYALDWLMQEDRELEELLPDEALAWTKSSVSLKEALRYIHRPPQGADVHLLKEGEHPVQKRLVFEEMLAYTLSLRELRNKTKQERAPCLKETGLFHRLEQKLPFKLTGAQKKVISTLFDDLSRPSPMMRLVQGDVGSGKTLVAVAAMLAAVESGKQAALMVPTEILAYQHYHNLRDLVGALGVNVCLMISRRRAAEVRLAQRQARTGEAQIIVGTHAVFQSKVEFARLALIVVDEQHRFGVHQRLALKQKGEDGVYQPHQLIMTATPIPRSLAMTMYADLDYSIIDEMPPGRLPVQTTVLAENRRGEIIARIRKVCTDGRQAYWVCPLIEESETLQYQTAEETFDLLQKEMPDVAIALIHGRMKSEEKEQVITDFKSGKIQLMVSTTVIEVGVDVPNANLMVIENAERFGLAQLHQLRGRIGRGGEQAYCTLLYRPPLSQSAFRRLRTMQRVTDGFKIAHEDMKIRGPGEVLGTRQTGAMRFRIADLVRDASELEKVLEFSHKLLANDPELSNRLTERWLGDTARYAEV